MVSIRSVGPRSSGSDTSNSQSLLPHSYFLAAIAIIIALVILRVLVLRWHNQKMTDFFRIHGNPLYNDSSPPNNPNYNSVYRRPPLTPLPVAYHPDRRVRAADIDAQGRRIGEDLGGKDALPAYDSLDRPPKYVEAGWPHGPPHPVEQSAATPVFEGEQSGMPHPNTIDGSPRDSMGRLSVNTHASLHDLSNS